MTMLRPALLAPFRDLTRLRHVLPLVLGEGDPPVRPLSDIVDALLREIAPRGPGGEHMRQSVLAVEREIRTDLARGEVGRLGEMWDRAAQRLGERGERVATDLATARQALTVDGEVVGSDVAARTVAHVWQAEQIRRSTSARARIDELITGVADVLRADLLRSPAGRRPTALRAGFAGPFSDLFDLDEMSSLIGGGRTGLTEVARERIAGILRTLREEMFFRADPAAFAFHSVYSALAAQRSRRPAMAALSAAMAAAERIVRGEVDLRSEGATFASGFFPDAFVALRTRGDPAACAHALEGLLSDVPLKVLVQVDDPTDPAARLATVAMGLGTVSVVQTTIAGLAETAPAIVRAVLYDGPAVISIFTGETGAGLPPYLVAAAAHEARAFPTFTYDPSAGSTWAARFALGAHPQPERDAPVHALAYEDAEMQRQSMEIPFTFADLALCDARLAEMLAVVPRERWDAMGASVVHAVDDDGRLHRLAPDATLAAMSAERAAEWQRLRELDALTHPPAPAAVETATAPPPVEEVPAPVGAPAEVAAAPNADEPYIETPRCSTCNECTKLNPRMFKYNENKQAYIADLAAGTYRELVEAAENCQVAIIHPGKPRDPAEPGLAELVERAAAFA